MVGLARMANAPKQPASSRGRQLSGRTDLRDVGVNIKMIRGTGGVCGAGTVAVRCGPEYGDMEAKHCDHGALDRPVTVAV